jgi:uncharacterized protein (DUF934 family)
MPRLISRGAVVEDRWTLLRDACALTSLPEHAPVIVPLALWLAERGALHQRGEVGVLLAPGDDPADLGGDVAMLPLIAVDFPQFTDGRGYSIARLLRERHGFAGELRAVGEVLRDQFHALAECGFDSFAVPDHRDAAAALAGLADFDSVYAPTARMPLPWFRRRARVAAGPNG